jgi:sulfur-oxidizing protein SoxY
MSMNTLKQTEQPNRREALISLGAGAVALVSLTMLPRAARADKAATDEAIKALIGDKSAQDGRITLDLPQIAENGNTVPIGVSVDSPMSEKDYVKAVHIVADGNPLPNVASFHFTPASGKASAATRMRLAKTQNVIAFAEMSDGSIYTAQATVKVTIGGCGG